MNDVRQIRRARAADYDTLVALWERSVRATHDFLTEADIGALRPLVREALSDDALELWVLTERADVPIGFMGLAGHDIAALFLEPARRGQGGGRRLVAHAQQLRDGAPDGRRQRAEPRGARLLRGARLRSRRPLAPRRRRSAIPDTPHAAANGLRPIDAPCRLSRRIDPTQPRPALWRHGRHRLDRLSPSSRRDGRSARTPRCVSTIVALERRRSREPARPSRRTRALRSCGRGRPSPRRGHR